MISPSCIRVVVVDDHAVFREGLVSQVNAEPDMNAVGEAGDARTGIKVALAAEAHVVLMDIHMPGMSAFTAAAEIRAQRTESRVVFLSGYDHDAYIEQALQAKAWGYITKNEPFATIRAGIRDVANGWVYYSSAVKSRIVNAPEGPRLAERATSRTSMLTPREIELLRYAAQGMSAKEIAATMQISPKTVDHHKTSLMTKLDIHDRVELARFAFREGIATP